MKAALRHLLSLLLPLLPPPCEDRVAGRWPLCCRHLSPSLLGWHTSTAAVTLRGPRPSPSRLEAGIPSIQTSFKSERLVWCVRCWAWYFASPSPTGRFFLECSRSVMRLLSLFVTVIVLIPYQWSNRTNETTTALTASKITCDPDSYESSHD